VWGVGWGCAVSAESKILLLLPTAYDVGKKTHGYPSLSPGGSCPAAPAAYVVYSTISGCDHTIVARSSSYAPAVSQYGFRLPSMPPAPRLK
jgi:hypothetical protein